MKCITNNLNFTNTESIQKIAEDNFKNHIVENTYPGRGIVIGRNQKGCLMLIFWIMGRSINSRNRLFKFEKGILSTAVANPSLLEDPTLIIYNVMRDVGKFVVVSNGRHTDAICEGLEHGKSIFSSLNEQKHEQDGPNYTPRISGLVDNSESSIILAKICKSDFSKDQSMHHYHRYTHIPSGYGYCITTYMNNGNPLPSFTGDPILLPLNGDANAIADIYWKGLNHENRISLFTREFAEKDEDNLKIINRFHS